MDMGIDPPTQGEIDAYEEARIEAEITGKLDDDKILRLLFIINLDTENRIRVLEGKSEILLETYKQALIDQYKAL
jgi:hypothetical protein